MPNLNKFSKWQLTKLINEMSHRPRKCPVELRDFGPLRESEIYLDVIALGYKEVSPPQGELQGNLRFAHPDFKDVIRVNANGRLWFDKPRKEGSSNESGRTTEIVPEYNVREKQHWQGVCMTIEEYKIRLQFLIKHLLYEQKFIDKIEYLNTESPNEIIVRKLDEDAINIKKLRVLPPSLKQDKGYIKQADEWGLF